MTINDTKDQRPTRPGWWWMLLVIAAIFAVGACSVLFPPEASGAEITYAWTAPDTTSAGVTVGPDYIDRYVVLHRSAATAAELEDAVAAMFGEVPDTTAVLVDVDPRLYHQIAVAAVDTFQTLEFPTGRTGGLSEWSLPFRPIDEDPGRPGVSSVPGVISSRVW